MSTKPKGPSMVEYASSKKKNGSVQSITIRKAEGGYIVDVSHEDYGIGGRPRVYSDIAGVLECVKSKLGGKK